MKNFSPEIDWPLNFKDQIIQIEKYVNEKAKSLVADLPNLRVYDDYDISDKCVTGYIKDHTDKLPFHILKCLDKKKYCLHLQQTVTDPLNLEFIDVWYEEGFGLRIKFNGDEIDADGLKASLVRLNEALEKFFNPSQEL